MTDRIVIWRRDARFLDSRFTVICSGIRGFFGVTPNRLHPFPVGREGLDRPGPGGGLEAGEDGVAAGPAGAAARDDRDLPGVPEAPQADLDLALGETGEAGQGCHAGVTVALFGGVIGQGQEDQAIGPMGRAVLPDPAGDGYGHNVTLWYTGGAGPHANSDEAPPLATAAGLRVARGQVVSLAPGRLSCGWSTGYPLPFVMRSSVPMISRASDSAARTASRASLMTSTASSR